MKLYRLFAFSVVFALTFVGLRSDSCNAAVTLGFAGLSNNSVTDTAIGEAQLNVTVDDAGSGYVSFLFENLGPAASSITDVYFDDDSLLAGPPQISSSTGVSFGAGAAPPILPSGTDASPPFVANQALSADSNPPVQANGVNPGEFLSLVFTLVGSQEFNDVLADLASGALRVGIHVQGFSGGGSETYVNAPAAIPEPGSIAVWSLISALVVVHISRSKSA